MNYIKSWENSTKRCNDPGRAIRYIRRDIARLGTEKQSKYYNDMIAFLRENGINTRIFERPRSSADCASKINAMNTIMRQHGIIEKFYEKEGD